MGTINLITQPTGGAPLSTDDYNYQNVDIGTLLNILDRKQLQLTEWDTITVPALARYVYINHGGAIFQVQDSDYAITDPGGLADGRLYIKVERSGDELDAEFVDDATGYSWNFVYNGFYHADGSQLLPYVLWLVSGTDFYKFELNSGNDNHLITAMVKKTMVMEIGDWNMMVSGGGGVASISYVHGLTYEWWKLIKQIRVTIRNDADSEYYDLSNFFNSGTATLLSGGTNGFTDTLIYLGSRTGGVFDNVNFNATSYNRGFIYITFGV
jgi:hypothetical protein